MSELNPSSATYTNLSSITAYNIGSQPLDYVNEDGETYVYFHDAAQRWKFYKSVSQVKQAVDSLAIWVAGKGYSTISSRDEVILEYLSGWGEDTFDSIMQNLIITMKIQGDAFAQIVREGRQLVNLIPISPERVRIVLAPNGRIRRYEYRSGLKDWKEIKKEDMFHLCNGRVGDEVHGTSIIESIKWEIEARLEAMDIKRKIMRRSLAMGVLYLDTDDATKIAAVVSQVQSAADKSEMLALPMGVAEIKDSRVTHEDFLEWIRYLDDRITRALGVPDIILGGSAQYTEASSKVGYLTFEQVYAAEQRKLEQDIWQQLAIKLTFSRPQSLKENMVSSEAANTGQVGFQPNETEVGVGRTE